MNTLYTLASPLFDIVLDWGFAAVVGGTLLISKVIYEDFLSPMSKLPGPPLASVGRFWWIYNLANGQFSEYIYRIALRYGTVARVDKNTIVITNCEDVKLVLGSTKFNKTSVYECFNVHRPNIFSTRDIALHRKLKHMIAPAFSMKSITEMEPLIQTAGVIPLLRRLESYAECGITFDIMQLFHHATLDITGEVAFGGSFNTLLAKPGEHHPVIGWVNDFTYLGLLFARSIIEKRIRENLEECNQDRNQSTKDVLQRLLESEDPETGKKFDIDQLISESVIQLIAGTDTTALTLTWSLHLLEAYPETMKLLKEELTTAFPNPKHTITHNEVKNLAYLNAVLFEVLRFRPVAPSTQRVSPKGGAVISGHFIPEGTTIIPSYKAIHYNPDIYGENTEVFNPSRWIDASKKQYQEMRQNFMGFSMGTRSCVGQNLAWMELRLLLANIVRRFDYMIPADARTDMTPIAYFALHPRSRKYYVQVKSCST
ncbi:cytochrome P450 [Syncephalis plumigaleata]|nr:cytochrome P450 [Syncephalis plumigaleata]